MRFSLRKELSWRFCHLPPVARLRLTHNPTGSNLCSYWNSRYFSRRSFFCFIDHNFSPEVVLTRYRDRMFPSNPPNFLSLPGPSNHVLAPNLLWQQVMLENDQKLHPCKRTLNSRNLGFAKDSFKDSFGQGPYVKDYFKVSLGFRTLWRPRLIKDPKKVKNHWLYCIFDQKH